MYKMCFMPQTKSLTTFLPKPRVLFFNSLNENYGSTYRLRLFQEGLLDRGFSVSSIECPNHFFLKFIYTFKILFRSFDLLFIQKFNPFTIMALVFAKLKGQKVMADFDDLDQTYQPNFIFRSITKLCEHMGPRLVDALTTHNDFLFQNTVHSNKHLIHQGFKSFSITIEPSSLKKEIGFIEDWSVLGIVLTLTHGGLKGFQEILSAFEKVVQIKPCYFLIVGGGPQHDWVSNLIEQKKLQPYIKITGLIDHSKVCNYINLMDVCLVYMEPSLGSDARVSLKTIEYLAFNKTVVGHLEGTSAKLFNDLIIQTSPNDFHKNILNALKHIKTNNFSDRLKPYTQSNIALNLEKAILSMF